MCLFSCTVGYTMDTMYFEALPNAVDVSQNVQLPQFSLVDWQVKDCSQNYTSGFRRLFTSCFDSLFPYQFIPRCSVFALFVIIFEF